jgi:hypothetical protein
MMKSPEWNEDFWTLTLFPNPAFVVLRLVSCFFFLGCASSRGFSFAGQTSLATIPLPASIPDSSREPLRGPVREAPTSTKDQHLAAALDDCQSDDAPEKKHPRLAPESMKGRLPPSHPWSRIPCYTRVVATLLNAPLSFNACGTPIGGFTGGHMWAKKQHAWRHSCPQPGLSKSKGDFLQ